MKYYLKEEKEYGCTVYQVINSETSIVAFYDADIEVSRRICEKWNELK